MKLISFGLKAKIKYGRTKPTPKDKNIGNVNKKIVLRRIQEPLP